MMGAWSFADSLQSIGAVRALSPHEASKGVPVKIEAKVILHQPARNDLFVHDGNHGIFVGPPSGFSEGRKPLEVGTRLLIEGKSTPGAFLPSVVASRIDVLGAGPAPEPRRPSAGELFAPALDCEWVEVGVVIKTIAWKENRLVCGVEIEGASAQVSIWSESHPTIPDWFAVERAFRLRGVAATVFNDRRQMIGRQFHAPSFAFLIPETQTTPSGSALKRKLDELLRVDGRLDERVRVRGTVTAIRPGAGLYLRGGSSALYVRSAQPPALTVGDEVEAEGYPELADVGPNLRATAVRKVGAGALAKPIVMDPTAPLLSGTHHNLIVVDGELLEIAKGRERATLVCQGGGRVFEATMEPVAELPEELAPGARLRLTGICIMHGDPLGFPEPLHSFSLQLRGPADLAVLAVAPWWTAQRIAWVLTGAGGVTLLAAAWALVLRRQVRLQTEVIRSKVHRESVLEERERIARELHDTLEQELLGVNMLLDHAAARMPFDGTESGAAQSLTLAARMLRRCRDESRSSIRDLRSVALETGDLCGALEELLRPLATLQDAEYSVASTGEPRRLSGTIETALLRLAHEAVANASRHSGARRIAVEVSYAPEAVRVRVQDDGRGFDPASVDESAGHFGLRGMRERAKKLGLILKIASTPGAGTNVEITATTP